MLSLKTKKKYSQKFVSHIKIDWHSKRQKESIEKKGRKTKNEKKLNNSKKHFFTYTFFI